MARRNRVSLIKADPGPSETAAGAYRGGPRREDDDAMLVAVRSLIARHGWNSTSYQLVNPGMRHWFAAAGDAVAGFVDVPGGRVVAGAPVAAADRLHAVCRELERDTAVLGRRLVYFGAERRMAEASRDEEHATVLLGAHPVWDPAGWSRRIREHASHRAQLHRARNKGVAVREWSAALASGHPALARCLTAWLAGRGLPPLHFLVEPDTLTRLEGRRVFVATREATVVAYLVLSPIPARHGWLFEQWVRGDGAVNGTVDLLVHTAMTALAGERVPYASLGLAPLSRHVEAEVGEPLWLRAIFTWLRAHGNRFYNFAGLDHFKSRLRPDAWEPVYAIAAAPAFRPAHLWAVASAFSDGHPLRMVAGGLMRAVRWELSGRPRRSAA